jgi:hypothetical protein
LVGSLGSTRKWVEPTAPAKATAPEKAAESTQPVDLTPLCKSIEKLADAVRNQPAPQVTMEPVVNVAAPIIPAPVPRSYVIKVTHNSKDLPIEYRLDPVSTPSKS